VPLSADQRTSRTGRDCAPGRKILASINELIKDIKRDRFKGLGKPEPSSTRCRAGGRAASQANIVWSIASPGKGGDRLIEVVQCSYHY
jgi:toxin YoeB